MPDRRGAAMQISAAHASLLDAMPDGVVVTDREGHIVHASPRLHEMAGYPDGSLTGESIEMLVPDDRRALHERHRSGYWSGGLPTRPMGVGLEIRLQRADGTVLPVDIALSSLELDDVPVVVAAVRDVTELRRSEHRLRAINEVAQAILTGGSSEALLHQVAASAARLVDAQAALVVVVSAPGQIEVRAGVGDGVADHTGSTFAGAALAGDVLRTGDGVIVDDAQEDERCVPEIARSGDLGPALVIPLWVRGEPFGALVVANRRGGTPLSQRDLAEQETFAAQAAVAIEYARTASEVQRLALVEDRERIARELHDTVIQRLFAAGMALHAFGPSDDSPEGERVRKVVDGLDAVIGEIRATIFALEPQVERGDVRVRVLAVVNEAASALRFRPGIRFDGPVDTLVEAGVADHLVSVVREALANVARHAGATDADVMVAARDDLVVEVTDNGRGATDRGNGEAGTGRGLRNLAARAEELGGTFSVEARETGGTRLVWRVPLAAVTP